MDIEKLNSATKYPSIPTYHEMGERGRLTQAVQAAFPGGQDIFLTEKVDGANGRVVLLPSGPRRHIIGSREEFLFAHGDLIFSSEYGIVKTLEPIAEKLEVPETEIAVYFFEVFGAGLPAAKQYSDAKVVAARLFDVAAVPLDILQKPIEQIASWRDHGGQRFMTVNELDRIPVQRTPTFGIVKELPATVEATYEWLKAHRKSLCDLGGGLGLCEGVVARTNDRKVIVKIRFEDYERTLGVKRDNRKNPVR